MKEFLSTAENLVRVALNNGRPELGKEMAVRLAADLYFYTWELTPEARYFLNGEVIPDMIAGKKRSLGADAEVLMSGFDYEFINSENIPEKGELLVEPNHYNKGPLHGYGTHFGVAIAVRRRRKSDIRFVLQDGLVNGLTGNRLWKTRELYEILNVTYNPLMVPPPELKVANGDEEKTSMETLRAFRQSFRNQEADCLYPELTGTDVLGEGHYLAGIVARSYLTNTNGHGRILPVGVFRDNSRLYLNFGEPYPVSELSGFFRRSTAEEKNEGLQKAANYMVAKINLLVPQRMRNPKLEEMFRQN